MTERSPLLTEKLGFFGIVMASLSHELKNALATVNEFSGLIEDIVQGRTGKAPNPERLQSICGRINNHIQRGEMIIQRLNRFAHSVDDPVKEVVITQLLTEIYKICERFATLKQVKLESRIPESTLSMTIDPFAFQHVIYLCITAALESATDSRIMTVVLEPQDAGCHVIIECADPLLKPEDLELVDVTLLRQLVADIGASLSWESSKLVLELR